MPEKKDWIEASLSLVAIFIATTLAGFNVGRDGKLDGWFMFFICLSLFLGSIIAWIFYLFGYKANRKLKELTEKYNTTFNEMIERHNKEIIERDKVTLNDSKTMADRIEECRNQNLTLQETCKAIHLREALASLILNEDQIAKLESSVPLGQEIIVMTSKFALEQEKYLSIIVDNFRKGIVYKYLIPNNGADIGTFGNTVVTWWNEFKKIIKDKQEFDNLALRVKHQELSLSEDFSDLFEECRNLHKMKKTDSSYKKSENALKEKFFAIFKKKVKTFEIDKNYSFITVIMYQRKNGNEWDVIIKLPTSANDKGYTAYLVPEDNLNEKRDLVSSIVQFCGDHLRDDQLHSKKIDIFTSFEGRFK